ncbi:CBS domain-containing protein [Gammaproteobacteria bacterium]|nr:CBS domain-containing protein [Gammaproteobacteria bacterium]
MKTDKFIIHEKKSLKEALKLIDANKTGIIFIVNDINVVTGVATDGDIRRNLLEGAQLENQIKDICNNEFVSCDIDTPRETLIKKLDTEVAAIPILDKDGKLSNVISRNHYPLVGEHDFYAQSRAPVRVSFGGGGSDLTHFFDKQDGAVINTAISIYSHATLIKRNDKKIIIHSLDLNDKLLADDLDDAINQTGNFGLIQSVIKLVNPSHGFELYIYSDFPMKSGLGGSATIAAAILECFNQFRTFPWNLYEMSELAFQAERLYLGIAGGWQDQYASVFGGFNFLEFKKDKNIIHPLKIQKNILLQLEECLLLCDTGIIHESGDIHSDQKNQMKQSDIINLVKLNVSLCYEMRNQLLRGDLKEFGISMNEAWHAKRKFSTKVSSPDLDNIYNNAIKSGALGGKLLGAGGGGFFLFYVEPKNRTKLTKYINETGLNQKNFKFESDGVLGWKVKNN